MLLCYECTPNVIHEDSYDLHIGQTGYERRDRDDEEEWQGVPIPQSDDSSSTDSEEEEENGTRYRDRNKDDTLAYLVGPRRDGRILNKDGTIIDVNEAFVKKIIRPHALPNNSQPAPNDVAIRPTWTRQLIAFQRNQLKKGHKRGRQKIAIKIMKQICTNVQRIEEQDIDKGLEMDKSQSNHNQGFLEPSQPHYPTTSMHECVDTTKSQHKQTRHSQIQPSYHST